MACLNCQANIATKAKRLLNSHGGLAVLGGPRHRTLVGWVVALTLALCLLLLAALPAHAADPPLVVVIKLDGGVHPAAADFVKRGIDAAGERGARLIVLEISTPGGLMTSMREITTAVVNAKVPVATFVSPSGARAGSAGFFILLAGDYAAMAPGTNAGAAHPVNSDGQDIGGTMLQKVEQDALAQIRTLCAARGRDPEAAEKAITQSLSYTETEALEKKLIDAIARDPAELCAKMDGVTLARTNGQKVTLDLKAPRFETVEPGTIARVLGIFSDPNVAYILFLVGLIGLYVEFTNPGGILPGAVGALALLLALYGFSVLPVNFAGVGLVILGLIFIVAEVKFPVHGALALSGVAVFIAGSLMLFSGNPFGYAVDLWIVLPGALLVGGVLAGLSIRAATIRRQQVTTGAEGLIGEAAQTLTELNPTGKVIAHGEYWNARSETPIPRDTPVVIVGRAGFTLLVAPAPQSKEAKS